MNYDIISFGSAILDVFLKSPSARVIELTDSETTKGLVFPYGAKCEVERLHFFSGGGGTNTAVGFARLGLKAAVVARCGWDFAGKIVRQQIKQEGVDDSLLVQLEREETDYSTVLLGPDGGRTILVYRGGTRLEAGLIDFANLKAKWFYTSSLEGNLELMQKLVEFARQNRIKIASNPGRREIEQKERLLGAAKFLNVLIVNHEEAAKLTGLLVNDRQVFPRLSELLPEVVVVVTKGQEGVWVSSPEEGKFKVDSLKVKMVDSTGAGDGFGSGFVGGLCLGWDLPKALRLGAANGAAVVTKVGSKPGLIKQTEIEQWLKEEIKITTIK